LPSHWSIGGSLLSQLQQEIDRKNKAEYSRQEVTLAADGWKNIKKDALVRFVINDHGKVIMLEVNDMTRKPKIGQVLFELIDNQLQKLLKKEAIIAVCTNDGGDYQLAHCLLQQKYPWLITTVCFAHQVCKLFIIKLSILLIRL
ncbi:hypothetical protein L873DRAFT_1717827, partial [Choiromyces venosus 120613-1]